MRRESNSNLWTEVRLSIEFSYCTQLSTNSISRQFEEYIAIHYNRDSRHHKNNILLLWSWSLLTLYALNSPVNYK